MKKNEYYAQAEQLYVTLNYTLIEISKQLGVSERSLRYWKEEGKWEEKRAEFMNLSTKLHADLYELANDLTKDIREKIKVGIDPASSKLYTLVKLLPLLTKTKEYEDSVMPAPEKNEEGITEKTKKQIRELFGLKTE